LHSAAQVTQHGSGLVREHGGHLRQTEEERYAQVMTLADMYLEWIDSFQDRTIMRLEGVEEGGPIRALWEATFKALFATAPALCVRLQQTQTFCQERLKQYARSTGCAM
jgi:hypothetical protein